MHFEIKNVSTDKDSGFTRIVISYNYGKQLEKDERGFDCPENANAYIGTMKRDYLKVMFEKYVHHANHIFQTSKLAYYEELNRNKSLTRCMNAVKVIAEEKSLDVVCSYIASSEMLLKHILPHPSNPSSDNSLERLNIMLSLSKQHLITLNKIKKTSTA